MHVRGRLRRVAGGGGLVVLVRLGEGLGDDRCARDGSRAYRGADQELAACFIVLAHADSSLWLLALSAGSRTIRIGRVADH